MATTKTGRKTPRRRSTQERHDEYVHLTALVEQFDLAGDTDGALAARFAHFCTIYSERNAILILAQKPDAIEVHGYVDWQKLGRQVRHGQTGIRIIAYTGSRPNKGKGDLSETDPAVIDPTTGKPTRRDFNPVSVFDITQTDPMGQDAEALAAVARFEANQAAKAAS
jgi:hypothetical protein